MMAAATSHPLLLVLQGLILLAALQDAMRLRISNLLALSIAACFAVWVAVVGPQWSLWQNGVAFTLAFAFGLLLFSRGLLGGGDVKLLGALALWFDLRGALALLVLTAVAGGVLALLLIALRRMLPDAVTSEGGFPLLRRRGPIPYGIAIAGGALLAIRLYGVNPMPLTALQRLNDLVPMP